MLAGGLTVLHRTIYGWTYDSNTCFNLIHANMYSQVEDKAISEINIMKQALNHLSELERECEMAVYTSIHRKLSG